jgi:hypothetical protein
MGGKTLKFPVRKKYVAPTKKVETQQEEISKEEHEERLRKLKELGLLK